MPALTIQLILFHSDILFNLFTFLATAISKSAGIQKSQSLSSPKPNNKINLHFFSPLNQLMIVSRVKEQPEGREQLKKPPSKI